MKLRYSDSFDHFATADLAARGWTLAGVPTINNGTGRNGTRSLRLGGSTATATRTIDAQDTWTVAVAIIPNLMPSASATLIALLDAGSLQVDLRLSNTGILTVTRNGTVLGTAGSAISSGVYHKFEYQAIIHPTAGSIVVRLDGSATPIINVTGANTRATANSSANQIRFGTYPTNTFDLEDLEIYDGTGGAGFAGDNRVDCRYPTGDTTYTNAFAVTGAANDYTAVSEAQQDGSTSYISSANPGDYSFFAYPGPSSAVASCKGVSINLWAWKDDAGVARTLGAALRIGGVIYDHPTTYTLSTTGANYQFIWETNPATSAAWTAGALAAGALEFGPKMVS